MKKFSIITVHKGNIRNLSRTVDSILKQNKKPSQHIIISPKLSKNFRKNYNKKFVKYIIGKDKSIYNAMNIGLNITNNNYVLFLNSGDELNSINSINTIFKIIQKNPNYIYIFKVLMKFKDKIYIPKKSYFFSSNYFPHPGFLRPPVRNRKVILFNETFDTISDGLWMEKNLKICKFKKIDEVLVNHYLGGISSIPTYKLAIEKMKISKYRFIKEVIKIVVYKLMSNKFYYKLISLNKFKLINE